MGEWQSIPGTSEIVLVEGVYALRPELRDFYDVKILVDTAVEVRIARLAARAENSKEWIDRWSAAESFYFENLFNTEHVARVFGAEGDFSNKKP